MTKYKLLTIALWSVFFFFVYHAYSSINEPQPVNPGTTLNEAQQELRNEFYALKKANVPVRRTVAETGKDVFIFPDGSASLLAPEWHKNGEITLSDQEWSQIAELDLFYSPFFVFWTDEITVVEYNNLIPEITIGLAVGLAYVLMLGQIFGLATSLVVVLLFGLIFGPACGLLFGLTYGLVHVSKKLWKLPGKHQPTQT